MTELVRFGQEQIPDNAPIPPPPPPHTHTRKHTPVYEDNKLLLGKNRIVRSCCEMSAYKMFLTIATPTTKSEICMQKCHR